MAYAARGSIISARIRNRTRNFRSVLQNRISKMPTMEDIYVGMHSCLIKCTNDHKQVFKEAALENIPLHKCEASAGMDDKWNSRRSPIYAKNGMVASSQPLATEIGLSILKAGGNAADAAVGVAAALNLVQPMSTGLGGDAFVLYFDAKEKKVKGINASGRCPANLSIDVMEKAGYSEINRPLPISPFWVTVPGAAAGWVDTIEQFGSKKLTLAQILQPAIDLAIEGFPVGQICAEGWKVHYHSLLTASPNGAELLDENQLPPKEGQIFKNPNLARTFQDLASNGKAGFYSGRVAKAIVDVMKTVGGFVTEEDLATHENTMDIPIHVNYHGVDVYEIPPNGQGITALLALNILDKFNIGNYAHNSTQHLHIIIECLRLAFADTRYYVTDPTFEHVPTEQLLSQKYAEERRNLIQTNKALQDIQHGFPTNGSNTVYFNVVDKDGNACSFINSVYFDFGSSIVPKGCGFVLHNRGNNFSLDGNHPNKLEPKKRPYHTIIPGMALKNGELWCPFGVMGGFMQPQGHLQVLCNMIDFGMNPQQALDAPRILINGGLASGEILLEDGIDESVKTELAARGHIKPEIVKGWRRADFGVGQIITRNPVSGVLCAGSDPRNDGMAIGW